MKRQSGVGQLSQFFPKTLPGLQEASRSVKSVPARSFTPGAFITEAACIKLTEDGLSSSYRLCVLALPGKLPIFAKSRPYVSLTLN